MEPTCVDPDRAELVVHVQVERDHEHAFRDAATRALTDPSLESSLRACGLLSVRLRQPVFAGDPVPWQILLGFRSLTDLGKFLDAPPDRDAAKVALEARDLLLAALKKLEGMRGVHVAPPEPGVVYRTWGITVPELDTEDEGAEDGSANPDRS